MHNFDTLNCWFLDAFNKGDGTKYINDSSCPSAYSEYRNETILRTSSRRMADDLCELILKAGWMPSVYVLHQKGKINKFDNGEYVLNTDCYNISICKSKYRYFGKDTQEGYKPNHNPIEVDYSGMVYDVELEKWHFLLVRRNGKCAWSGNCRGIWTRYNSTVDALVAHLQNNSELYNKALDKARAEYKARGIEKPNDKTPGFVDQVQEIYDGLMGVNKAFNLSQPRDGQGRRAEGPDTGGLGGGSRELWDSSTGKAKELKAEDWGTPGEIAEMARMERQAKNRVEATVILKEIAKHGELKSRSGLKAVLPNRNIPKIVSDVAIEGLINREAHFLAAANVDKLFSNAIEPWKFELNPNNDDLKERRILYSPMEYNGRIIPIKFTVKEYFDERRGVKLYSIEAIDTDITSKTGERLVNVTGRMVAKSTPFASSRLVAPQKKDAGQQRDGVLEKSSALSLPARHPSIVNIAHLFDPVNTYLARTRVTGKVFEVLYGGGQSSGMGKSLTWSGHKLHGRYKFAGFDISVENKAGSTRSGVDKDGHEWHSKMYFDYGYIRGSVGVDGDHVDVYIGPDESATYVYVVHQNDPVTGEYDEDKVMLGFPSLKAARTAYLKQYDRPGFLGGIDTFPLEVFREKVLSKKSHGHMIKSYSEMVREVLVRRS